MTIPASFISNTDARMNEYLIQSNLIEDISEIDYRKSEHRKEGEGHFGALIHSQQLAIDRKPLSHREIRYWQSLLTKEQKPYGHLIDDCEIGHIRSVSLQKNVRVGDHVGAPFQFVPLMLQELIEGINKELKDQEKLKDDVEYCKFLGRSFQTFESIHPFTDGNGRTGRLLANYIATFCRRPVIIFSAKEPERRQYYSAHKSPDEMSRFMAKKIKEAIFGIEGNVMLQKDGGSSGSSQSYVSGSGKKTLVEKCEWHALDSYIKE